MNHDGRLAAVTGAARGIGLATCQALGRAGARIAMIDSDAHEVEKAVAGLCAEGIDARGYALDISDERAVQEVFAELGASGTVQILVNNAGIAPKPGGVKASIEHLGLVQWQRVLDVNLTGAFLCTRVVIPGMKEAGWGRVINLSSQGGRTGGIFSSVDYAASKAGLIGFARTLAAEVSGTGITVNCVAPGRVATDMAALPTEAALQQEFLTKLPVPRAARPDEIAAAIVYLSSDEASYITGVTLDINGGGFMA
jgi:3-oxoacyl-[acyl-carrier protein] reductase